MDKRKRSIGVTIFSVTEMILGVVGLGLGTMYLIQSLTMYQSELAATNKGFAIMFTVGCYFLGCVMLTAGKLMFSLKRAGWIINIIFMILLLPTSIPLLIYLAIPPVKKQFEKEVTEGSAGAENQSK